MKKTDLFRILVLTPLRFPCWVVYSLDVVINRIALFPVRRLEQKMFRGEIPAQDAIEQVRAWDAAYTEMSGFRWAYWNILRQMERHAEKD